MAISLEGLNKAAVFASLFNRAKAQGLGFLHYNPELMTEDQAQERFGECDGYYDYVDGRVMKVDLSGDELETGPYNRDNGIDAAETVIKELRDSGDVSSAKSEYEHTENVRDSAAFTKSHLFDRPNVEVTDGMLKIELVAGDVADILAPKLDDILDE